MSFIVSMDSLIKKLSLAIFIFLTGVGGAFATGAAQDSVGMEKIGGKTYIIHEVTAKETLFAISRRYETPVGDIIKNNDELKQGLKIGQRIKVPYTPKTEIPEGAVLHKVAPGETLFSVAQKYGVAVTDVKAWNDLKGDDLSVGQGLIIQGAKPKETPKREAPELRGNPTEVKPSMSEPTPEVAKKEVVIEEKSQKEKTPKKVEEVSAPVTETERIEEVTDDEGTGWITHTVKDGETLYSISKKYDANMGDLINWNVLSSNNLREGQKLKVGRKEGAVNNPSPSSTSPDVPDQKEVKGASEQAAASTAAVKKASNESTAYKNIKESGQAEVIEGTGNHKKYLVLHKTAPVGTIMRIRNEENDVTIFARVVGKLPDTGDNDELLIKVSQAAFDQLRAVNNRFRVEVSY
ncbi:peptidoglycan-binding protein [Echinicola strongylocentroti]|uniref:Peptidoglycan-binding protein n=1 Tax=Echinicola strongylocentroti TaxID=1795355 RepID=A0A2Z4IKJ4_9BACT|nr:LysM peptidoglycan-binding domain-containing protein [Echinicola strongylocentroti]AWW31631.1 peptidoglycan-binding protein [Echinicola strongylocentroti]